MQELGRDKANNQSLELSDVSLRRDRIGRTVARGMGVGSVVFGIVEALRAHNIWKAVQVLLVVGAFCAWIFETARTAPGPAADDSEASLDEPPNKRLDPSRRMIKE